MAIGTRSVTEICERAKRASHELATLDTATKNAALAAIAAELEARTEEILEANAGDLEDGRAAGLDAALLDRLALDEGRIRLMAEGVRDIIDLPDPVGEEESRRWPLRLLTAPGYYQSHTAFSGIAALRRRQGPPACVLHPDEAAARGLSDGDAVELLNDRGSVRFVLRVSDEAPLGVAYVSGQRPSGEAIAGTINMLCSDRYSDLGEGATYQDTRLDVRAVAAERAVAAR